MRFKDFLKEQEDSSGPHSGAENNANSGYPVKSKYQQAEYPASQPLKKRMKKNLSGEK